MDLEKAPKEKTEKLREVDFNINEDIDRLDDIIIIESRHIPFTPLTLINENKVLNQIEVIRTNLPNAIEKAIKVLEKKQQIIAEAEDYADQIVEKATKRAEDLVDQSVILQQAQIEASQIKQRVQYDCEAFKHKTMAEMEQLQTRTYQEIEQLRQISNSDCEQRENGTKDYVEDILNRVEQNLAAMLNTVNNLRQYLDNNPPPSHNTHNQQRPKSSR